ncbi:hypothetical protein PSACC_01188 [Paramicrosporidium saccamoebae]|uniref:Uncharacterized protein n=1 Tax=Paramicrosporidium saccamoebae TaxID=1246581 RepID=A0A2H9TML6_9FUNG|nr:hypothetical protein PSACC_01188 [Paramicrosporidium saccamoebae]
MERRLTELGEPNGDPSAVRRTFAGFTRVIGGETRGRFLIERDEERPSLVRGPTAEHLERFATFVLRDRRRRRARKRLIGLTPYRLAVGWELIPTPIFRIRPKIEPMVANGSRTIEFPMEGAAVITRRAITTLLGGAMRRKTPDVLYVLNCVLLAVIDGRETRACLLLHVGFGLALPGSVQVMSDGKIPDMVGSLSAGLLKKKSHYPVMNRIFLQALDRGMESLCVMIGEAGFPRSFDDPIFTVKGVLSRVRVLPSYLILAVALGRATVVRMMLTRGANSAEGWLGLTPLLLAPCGEHPKASTVIARLLLETGADARKTISQHQLRRLEKMATLLRMTTAIETVCLSKTQVRHIYALDMAAAMCNCDTVVLLLTAMRGGGDSRMCLLTQVDLDITVRLLKMGADMFQRDAEDSTPLHLAARYGRTENVAVSALHEAAQGGHGPVLQLLISKGGDCTLQDVDGKTPLQLALAHGIRTEDLLDYLTMEEDLRTLINRVEELQLDETPKRRRRFLIEKFMPRWLGGREDDGERSERTNKS